MKKITQFLICCILVIGIVACHASMKNSTENSNIMERTSNTMVVSNDCIDSTKKEFVACAEIYEPVCGCDGRTYSNPCHAKREGVISWEEGTCRQSSKTEKTLDRFIILLDSTAFPEIIAFEKKEAINVRPEPNQHSEFEEFVKQRLTQFAKNKLAISAEQIKQIYSGPMLGLTVQVPMEKQKAFLDQVKNIKEIRSVEEDQEVGIH